MVDVRTFVDRLEELREIRGESAVEAEYVKLDPEDREAVLREVRARNELLKAENAALRAQFWHRRGGEPE